MAFSVVFFVEKQVSEHKATYKKEITKKKDNIKKKLYKKEPECH